MQRFTAITLALAAVAAMPAAANAADTRNQGYMTDRNGNPVTVRSSGCVKSRDWTPTRANKQCEGKVVDTKASGRPAR